METGIPYNVIYRLKVKSGAYRWFQATGGVVKDRRGKVRRASGSLVDIHDSKALELEQRQAVTVLLDRIRGTAAGQLTGRITEDFPDRFAELRTDFNAAMDSLCTTIGGVSQTSGVIRSGTDEIRSAADDLSRRTEQQAASLEESAAAITASSEQVGTGSKLVVETGQALQRISGRINEISGLMTGMASTAKQQASSLEQINIAIGEMDGGSARSRVGPFMRAIAQPGMALHGAGDIGDQIERSPLRLDIEASQIFADHAQHEHLHRAQDDGDEHGRGPALHRRSGQPADRDIDQQQQRRRRQRKADMAGPAQGAVEKPVTASKASAIILPSG